MPKTIQIRRVPDAVHRRLEARAASENLTLSDYLLREIQAIVSYPTNEEILARLSRLEPVRSDVPAVEEVRAERAEREADLA